jgi:hypothetical protein
MFSHLLRPPTDVPPTLGVEDGVTLGVSDGLTLGVADGVTLGVSDGVTLGVADGVTLGVSDGVTLGVLDPVVALPETVPPALPSSRKHLSFSVPMSESQRLVGAPALLPGWVYWAKDAPVIASNAAAIAGPRNFSFIRASFMQLLLFQQAACRAAAVCATIARAWP